MKQFRKTYLLFCSRFWLWPFFCLLIACSEDGGLPDVPLRPENVDNIRNYIASGKQDSIIAACRPCYEKALLNRDTVGILYSGAVMAQACLFKEKLEQLRPLLDTLERYETLRMPAEVGAILVNVRGLYAIKSGLDYRTALKYYHQGLEYTERTHNVDNRISFLTNIVNIYYLISDRHGLVYAEQARELAGTCPCTPFSLCMVQVAMAQMLSLDARNEEALRYVEQARELALVYNYRSFFASICLIQANIHAEMGQVSQAEELFEEAGRYLPDSEQSVTTWYYLRYGDFRRTTGRMDQAMKLYRAGMINSFRFNSLEFRKELLERMVDVCLQTADFGVRLQSLQEHLDSIPSERNVQEFHDLERRYQRQKYELEIQTERLARARAERRTTRILAVVSVCLVLFVSGIVLLVRRNRMYRILVAQNQNCFRQMAAIDYVQTQISAAAAAGCCDDRDLLLFSQIEALMKTKKIFKENDLSLEKLSEYVGSNRNYVSRAINRYAGQSFHNYVNMYRINEAISIITRSGKGEILLKALSIELGFSSLSVFSKAFVKRTGVAPTIYIKELHKGKSV